MQLQANFKKPKFRGAFVWDFVKNLFSNIRKCFLLMGRVERILSVVLFAIGLILLGFRCYKSYLSQTISAPSDGGKYTEAIVGEVKYLSPVLVQSEAEKSVSSLLFSGLVRIKDQNISPDLADRWEISPDGKKYTFYLKKDAVFNDGQPVTANDIAYTIDLIKAPETKSPLNKIWTDVEVEIPEDDQIVFTLPTAYGPFIYNCNFGVIPANLSSDEFAKSLTGSGPYKFGSFQKDTKGIREIEITRNDRYYGQKPLIKNMAFELFTQKADAIKDFESKDDILALFGATSNIGKSLDFQSAKRLGLIFNLRDDKLKDKAVRQKIVERTSFDQKLSLTLTTMDSEFQHGKAEELKRELAPLNVELSINYLDPIQFQAAITNKSYQLLLYGFDFGYDRDPYSFWHTSQLNNLNLAGWSDKDSDILLEDARMISEPSERNAKYDQFFAKVSSEYLAVLYDPVSYNFTIKDTLKGINKISGNQALSRFAGESSWYVKEKRVKK